MPELKRVEPQDILPERGGKVSLSPLQKVGVRGTLAVGAVGISVLLILLVRWIFLEPAVPSIPASFDEKQAAAILSRYKELQALSLDSTLRVIDAVVVKILLPVFTSFVGYVFGSEAGSRRF